jgi:hypothetical protein
MMQSPHASYAVGNLAIILWWVFGGCNVAWHSTTQGPAQAMQIPKAIRFHQKSWHSNIFTLELPFAGIAMLKYPPAFEIVLAHDSVQALNSTGRHGIRLVQFAEGQVVGVFVPMNVAVPLTSS